MRIVPGLVQSRVRVAPIGSAIRVRCQVARHEDGHCRHSADEARCRAASARAARRDADDRLRREGYARQRGQLETYRGHEYKTNLLRKVALEIAVNDDFRRPHGRVPGRRRPHERRRPHRRRQDLRRADGRGDSDQRRLPRQRGHLGDRMAVVLLSGDLMGASRVEGAARLAGVDVSHGRQRRRGRRVLCRASR